MTVPSAQIDVLLDQLKQPISAKNEAAGEAAAIDLGELGAAALPAIDALLASSNSDHRFWAVRSLWANGSGAAQKRLIALLNDADALIRSAAALALGELKAEAAVPHLVKLMTGDESPAGDHAGDALAKIGRPSEAALIAALQHPDTWARIRVVKALVPLESKSAIPSLIHVLDNDDSYLVRHYADQALKRMGVGEMVYFVL